MNISKPRKRLSLIYKNYNLIEDLVILTIAIGLLIALAIILTGSL